MPRRTTPRISARKQPRQARSTDLVAAVLEAAVQVLDREGADRFTMARVAERAGVSVGSLYQYFPNKAALLFRLQSDEWRDTSGQLRALLEDPERPALDRLRSAVVAFLRSECAEAAVRGALDDAAPHYRDASEAIAVRAESRDLVATFLDGALPLAPQETRALAADVLKTTLAAVGKRFSERADAQATVDAFAGGVADMLCAYVRELAG
ncbi:MAG: TetR family transcriptional regulator [Myxococcales bacterium]|nr:TetR family transcriptional regulator [Myxococcales bacterium]MCB9736096.1 TetR family transcriptional regulator [Deltaproteobacteria bacterium]